MVRCYPCVVLVIILKEWHFCYPYKIELALRDNAKTLSADKSECAQSWKNYLVLVCTDEDKVAFFCSNGFVYLLKIALAKKLLE